MRHGARRGDPFRPPTLAHQKQHSLWRWSGLRQPFHPAPPAPPAPLPPLPLQLAAAGADAAAADAASDHPYMASFADATNITNPNGAAAVLNEGEPGALGRCERPLAAAPLACRRGDAHNLRRSRPAGGGGEKARKRRTPRQSRFA